ncbi:MAG: hypothetical protein COB14_04340 [Alphaproteobacteria bacterium]|nr:MAG: hypothetical protein COB14_04340 [Alphaproteobacteria bacterium]
MINKDNTNKPKELGEARKKEICRAVLREHEAFLAEDFGGVDLTAYTEVETAFILSCEWHIIITRPDTPKETSSVPTEPNKGTQHYNILKLMRSRSKGITVQQAILEFDIQSLPKRISELREMGWPIISTQHTHPTKQNVRYAKYVLDTEALK